MASVLDRLHLTIACGPNMSIQERVAMVKDLINEACAFFLAGKNLKGTEAFSRLLLDRINDAMLIEEKMFDVSEVGVHPDNREKSGLVAMDAQDLLLLIFNNGFNHTLLSLLACSIPHTAEGNEWREVNERIARESNGFLPDARSSLMKIVTCWGSHTTGSLRIAKFGAKCVHPALDSGDGTVSMARIIEQKPSFRDPLEKGMVYTVIHGDLVTACPKLMHVLSRAGNVSHGVHRRHTTLQMALSVFHASKGEAAADKESCKAIACQGQTKEFVDNFDTLYDFVNAHCGGYDGKYLIGLEQFERSVSVKRTISFQTLNRLASVKIHSASGPRYIPALIKAYLAAPASKVKNGIADLLGPSDFAGLSSKGSKIHTMAVEASNLMVKASLFLDAYGTKDANEFRHAVDVFEQKLVMFVHRIIVETRKTYPSNAAILSDFYGDIKLIDPCLPKWSLVPQGGVAPVDAKSANHFDELNETGAISNAGLARKGFKIDVYVKQAKKDATTTYQILCLDDPTSVTTKVVLKDGTLGEEEHRIPRVELMLEYTPSSHAKLVVHKPRVETKDVVKDVIISNIKSALLAYCIKHSTDSEIHAVGDKLEVVPTTKRVCFVAFSKVIVASPTPKTSCSQAYYIGHTDRTGYMYIAVTSTTAKDIYDEERQVMPFAIVALSKTKEDAIVNMELEYKELKVKLYDGVEVQLRVPCFVNTKPFKAGDSCYISCMESAPVQPPAPKAPKGKGGKGKGKQRK